jgi:hypothetical protein
VSQDANQAKDMAERDLRDYERQLGVKAVMENKDLTQTTDLDLPVNQSLNQIQKKISVFNKSKAI